MFSIMHVFLFGALKIEKIQIMMLFGFLPSPQASFSCLEGFEGSGLSGVHVHIIIFYDLLCKLLIGCVCCACGVN